MKQPTWHLGSSLNWGAMPYLFDPSNEAILTAKKIPLINPGEPILLVENEPRKWYGLPFPVLMKFDRFEENDYGPYDRVGKMVFIDSKEKAYYNAPNDFSRDEVLISVGESYRSFPHYWIVGKEAVRFEEPIMMKGLRVPQVTPIPKGRTYQTGNLNLSQDGRIVFGEDLERVLRETEANNYLRWMTSKRQNSLPTSL